MSKRAAIYCRISRDPEGLRAGVDRQEEDCRKLAKRQGYRVAVVYTDNDISASRYTKKKRPQFEAMLDAARRGDVDVIVAYSNSRLTRRLLELQRLIALHESTGVQIETVVSGNDDLSTADGRMTANIKASVDQGEVERQSERIRRAHLQRAQQGRTNHGGRPFGWQADKLTVDATEATLIHKAARDLLDGVPLRRVAADWNAAGVKTARGGEWTHTTLRRMLQRPRMVGLREHRGAIVDGVQGEWEPLLDRPTWDALQVMFERDGRASGTRRGARKYLLTGLIRCGVCGARMNGSKTPSGYAYTCCREGAGHTNTIEGSRTDAVVLATARARLESERFEPVAAPVVDPTPGKLADIAEQIGELMAAYQGKQLSAGVVFPLVGKLEAERAALEAEQTKAAAAVPLVPASVSADDLDGLSDERRAAVLAVLFEAIVVKPAGRRGERWTVDRLDLTGWRG